MSRTRECSVYMLWGCNAATPDDIKTYVGSTRGSVESRLKQHHKAHHLQAGGAPSSKYYSSFQILEMDEHHLQVLETFPADISTSELRANEEAWRKAEIEVGRCVNQTRAHVADAEQREVQREHSRASYARHREEILGRIRDEPQEKRDARNARRNERLESVPWKKPTREQQDRINARKRARWAEKKAAKAAAAAVVK